jgi:hypothetical protein
VPKAFRSWTGWSHRGRRTRRPLHHELAFRSEFPADVLEHEDVAVIGKVLHVDREIAGRALDAVRRPLHDEGQRSGPCLRDEQLRVQAHTIARGDHDIAHVEAGRDILRRNRRRT